MYISCVQYRILSDYFLKVSVKRKHVKNVIFNIMITKQKWRV